MRGLQPRRQDPRRRTTAVPSATAAWCCGTRPHAKRLADDPLPVSEGRVRSVAFSPDGKTLAAGFGGGGCATPAAWCCGTWPRASAWRTTRSP